MNRKGIYVYLISGFLGNGKTTFLNHVLNEAPSNVKLLIEMNEFGDEGIDGSLILDPDLEMLEIGKGSIFRARVKGDFIKALHRIAFVIKTDVLIIEASGVANPTDMGRIIFNPLYEGRYMHMENVCIIDAANFLEQYEIFKAIEKQIEATHAFIINKTDLVEPGTVDSVKNIIQGHCPQAAFVETSFTKVKTSELFSFADATDADNSREIESSAEFLDDEALEEFMGSILDDEVAQATPPEIMISVTCRWLSGSMSDFRHVAENLPSDVVRAKGFVFENGLPFLYSHVGHAFEIVPFEGSRILNRSVNRAVFIRRECREDDIRSMFEYRGLGLIHTERH